MKYVYKYRLNFPADEQFIALPVGAELLQIAFQAPNFLALWARVDPNASLVSRRILTRGTGHPIDDEPYICTIFDGPFVWHFFDGGE